jgi:hypothetical protein
MKKKKNETEKKEDNKRKEKKTRRESILERIERIEKNKGKKR